MSLIPNLSEIPDLAPVAPGEYDLRVIKAQASHSDKTGRNGVLLICDIIGEDEASNLMHALWFGNDGQYKKDDEDKSNLMWRMVKDFLRSVGLSEDGEIELEDLAKMLEAAQEGIKRRGKAKVGEKTMLDTIYPASESLKNSLSKNLSLKDALQDMKKAAREGMESTKDLISQRGRSSRLGERTVGHIDPGAASSYLIIESAVDYLINELG